MKLVIYKTHITEFESLTLKVYMKLRRLSIEGSYKWTLLGPEY